MRLTDEQRAVVEHQGGHARVAAVAGSGKTTTMVARVLHLLSQGVPPSRILVLMFNRSAREDFQARLAEMAPAGQPLPDVRTFHSLGHRLTQSLTRWGVLSPRQLLTADWQLERLLRQATLQALADEPEAREMALDPEKLEALAQFCALVKAEMVTPDELYARTDFGDDTEHFVSAFMHAERLLDAHAQMSYADLLYRPLRALEADRSLLARVQGFLDHVIIDEYQDINVAQQRLMALLAVPNAAVMAVGDANQCIYEWRGAHPDTMLERFTATFGVARDYPLSTTFRHGHALALAANHAIAANRRRPDQLCLATDDNPQTRLAVAQGSRGLLDELDAWQRRRGRPLIQACVLVRSWALSVPLQLALLNAGVPFRLAREDRFVFRLPLVQALAGYLLLARRPERLRDSEHLALLLSQPTPFVSRERIQALANRLAETQQWPPRHDPLLEGLKPHQKRTLKRRWALLCELPRRASWPPGRLLAHVVEAVEAEKVLKRAATRRDKGEEDVRLLDVLLEQAEEFSNDPDGFIELLRRPVENRTDGVLITTVHGAKGLEWPLVILAGANEEDFPHYSRDNPLSGSRLEEERRLYYVAITRAQEHLLLLHDAGDHRPSRFIAETAVEECCLIARRLNATNGVYENGAYENGACENGAYETELAVSRREIVEPYLERLGRDLPLASRPEGVAEANPWADDFVVGQWLRHAVFGDGEISVVEGDPANPVIEVRFRSAGRRRLIARLAPIELLAGETA
ncbi:ATP-dependent helicase [Halomonas urumqiensis]|uniref:DNA 3'-5' helicase n=1 Tax=Halomonas urumqiensis TaxID=1684789 RepID=A0A2N7UGJ8_9GAMM|nr:ATP-dependent helicase [Halomonas urumqiensis]PMR79541.1 ATP-dependent helicase [Halomonas urumqiensis]PTB01338.1 ATP-dependent helicase [Halomonas urumqiensis]GHE22587.1 DNA helicase [Halomonas urumqiensis]